MNRRDYGRAIQPLDARLRKVRKLAQQAKTAGSADLRDEIADVEQGLLHEHNVLKRRLFRDMPAFAEFAQPVMSALEQRGAVRRPQTVWFRCVSVHAVHGVLLSLALGYWFATTISPETVSHFQVQLAFGHPPPPQGGPLGVVEAVSQIGLKTFLE